MRREAAVFGALGMAPDLDLLVGAHSTYTHSLGAVVLTAIAALVWTRRPRLAVACAAAVASHVLLDWLGSDTTPPLGIMALWPLTREFYQSHAFLFMAISRRWWLRVQHAERHRRLAGTRHPAAYRPADRDCLDAIWCARVLAAG